MEVPTEVMIHNQLLGMKGTKGTLIQINPGGYYELNVSFGSNVHRVLMPMGETVIIAQEAEAEVEPGIEIER